MRTPYVAAGMIAVFLLIGGADDSGCATSGKGGSSKPQPKEPNKGDNPRGNCSVSFSSRAPRISPTSVSGSASVYCQKPYPTTHVFVIELQIQSGKRWTTVDTDSSSDTPSPRIRLNVSSVCEVGSFRIHAESEGIAANGFDISWSGNTYTATVTEGTCHD